MSESHRLGGQALIEGVMIRAGDRWGAAVRRPDGAIETHQGTVPRWAGSAGRVPIVRGAIALAATMALGMRALSWSRAVADGRESGAASGAGGSSPSRAGVVVATTVSVAVLVSLFAVLPALAARALVGEGGVAFAVLEAVVRLGLLVGYIAAIGRLPGIGRTFEYHGAEHQAVAAFEAGVPLEPNELRRFSPRHARCGTDFLVLVALVGVVAFAVVSPSSPWVLLASRVVLLPAVAGVAYEVLRLSGRPTGLHLLLAPGLAVQRLTTRPPTDDQVEVAIAAVQAAVSEKRARSF
jgi:uncharacterized protein YqhQ